MEFYVGDIVKLKGSSSELIVLGVKEDLVTAKYLNSDYKLFNRPETHFTLVKKETKMTDTAKLYQFPSAAGEDLYGHYLATNSQGSWIMEVKGSGAILAVDKTKVAEVLPYSIGVQFSAGGTVYNYLAEKDKFTLGFYMHEISSGWQIVQVVKLDTKSSKATKEFSPIGKLPVDLY